MTYHACVKIRTCTRADLPALMALKEAAGWNQTGEDWLRLLRLEPEGCFAMEVDEQVAASATVVNAELKYDFVTQPRSHGPQ